MKCGICGCTEFARAYFTMEGEEVNGADGYDYSTLRCIKCHNTSGFSVELHSIEKMRVDYAMSNPKPNCHTCPLLHANEKAEMEAMGTETNTHCPYSKYGPDLDFCDKHPLYYDWAIKRSLHLHKIMVQQGMR